MCDTMASIPIEDNSPYVLTEDMIDAAMTEQYSCLDDAESGDEFNSPDYSLHIDLPSYPEKINNSIFSSAEQRKSDENVTTNMDESSGTVVVIETGLNKSNDSLVENNETDKGSGTSKTNKTNDATEKQINSLENSTNTNNISVTTNLNKESSKEVAENKEPLLKSILKNHNHIESIDLCNSDTESSSADEYTEAETLDTELQSVMESNLRSEIGIAAQNKVLNSSLDPMNSLKLQVQNVTQISPLTFNNMSEVDRSSETHEKEVQTENNRTQACENVPISLKVSNFVVKTTKESPAPIHLNKIAVPHQTYISKKGQTMKCVYVRNTLTPVIINSYQQPPSSTKNVTFMPPPEAKKPKSVSPTSLFSNITKRPPFDQPAESYNSQSLAASKTFHAVNQPPFSANNHVNSPNSKQNLSNSEVNFPPIKSVLLNNQVVFTSNKPLLSSSQPSFEASPSNFSNKSTLVTDKTNFANQLRLQPNLPNLPVNQPHPSTSNLNFSTQRPFVVGNNKSTLHYKPNQTAPQQLTRTVEGGQLQNLRSSPSAQLNEREVAIIKSLLFHNLKKPYSPVEMRNRTTLFICPDCNDKFVIQSSLTNHLSRRSLVIRYWCKSCLLDLHFFNRCAFLRHLRNHKQTISHLDFSKIIVNPLPIEMVEAGVLSSHFIENPENSCLPSEDCIISKPTTNMLGHFEMGKQTDGPFSIYKPTTSHETFPPSRVFSPSEPSILNQPRNSQPQLSLLLNKPVAPQFALTSKSMREESLMPVVPKSTGFVPTASSKTQIKELLVDAAKSVPKKIVLLLDKKNNNVNLTQNAKISVLPPNELFSVPESAIGSGSTPNQTYSVLQEEEIDVETVVAENSSNSMSPVIFVENGTHPMSPSVNVDNGLNSFSSSTADGKKAPNKSKQQSLPHNAFKKVLCYDCGNSCLNISKHLNGNGRPTNLNLACTKCDLLLPTKCALKCHIRIHNNLPPYKCPDCGKEFPSWKELYSHLKLSCGHFAKCVRYKCMSCKYHFPSKSSLGHHIVNKHTRDVFKCSSCPVAFYNRSSIDHHMITTVHKDKAVVLSNHKLCDMCPKKLLLIEEFVNHIHNHTNSSSVLIYGYKCSMCTLTFANKTSFVVHQLKERNERSSQENANSDFEFVANFPVEDNSSTAEKDPLSSDGCDVSQDQKVNEKREEVCIVCKKNSVYLLPGISLNEQSLCCKQCVKPLDVDYTVESGQATNNRKIHNTKHIISTSSSIKLEKNKLQKSFSKPAKRLSTDEKHPIGPKRQRTSEVHSHSVASTEPNTNLKSDFNPSKKKSRSKNVNRQRTDYGPSSSRIQGQIISFRPPNELSCAKCSFVAGTKENFLAHIVKHRVDPNTYQCLECGLCFVVLPPLERHLQMRHGIKNVSDYIQQNKSCVPRKAEEKQRLQENQCRVCLEIFDSNSSLEKHFRTHGMAFMNSLRKSP